MHLCKAATHSEEVDNAFTALPLPLIVGAPEGKFGELCAGAEKTIAVHVSVQVW